MQIGTFSVEESLTQGITLIYRCPRLVLPFILAALVSAIIQWGARLALGIDVFGSTALMVVLFPVGVISTLISSWGIWLVIWRYGDQRIGRLEDGPRIGGYRAFLTGEKGMLSNIVLFSLIISLISLGEWPAFSVLGGFFFISIGIWALFRFISFALSFSIYGILIFRLPTLDAIWLSRDIVIKNLLITIGLSVGIMIIGYVVNLFFSILMMPVMWFFSDMSPIQAIGIQEIIRAPAGGIIGAIRASCMCYAFLSVFGKVDSVAVAVRHGKALPECPGSPKLPDCAGCREMQDFGDKVYCTRFSRAVLKERENPPD
jgi:hypothetical protein